MAALVIIFFIVIWFAIWFITQTAGLDEREIERRAVEGEQAEHPIREL